MKLIGKKQAAGLAALVAAAVLGLPWTAEAAPLEGKENTTTPGGLKEHLLPPQETPKPKIEVEQAAVQPGPTDATKIPVAHIRVTGQELFGDAELQPLLQEAYGKELTLAELEQYARKVSQYFHSKGYLVARAILPPQSIEEGQVEMQVLVGRYGKIRVDNQSRLQTVSAEGLLQGLRPGAYIREKELERALLLLSDTAGVQSAASLTAGEEPGTADLVVRLTDGPRSNGQLYTDNHGSRYTGKNRLGLNWNFLNVSGQGDIAGAGVILGEDRTDYNLSYQRPLGASGAKWGLSYARQTYSLGDAFANLNADGVSDTWSLFASYPMVRSRDYNLNGRFGYDHKKLEDRIGYAGTNNRKKADVWNAGLSGDSRDSFGGGGYNSFSLSLAYGRLSLDSADAVTNDAEAHTSGNYTKGNLNLYRVQNVNSRLALHLSLAAQAASKNLDSSEKMSLGGPSGVRAYPVNEACGDSGYVATGELRWNLPNPTLQLAAYVDQGHVNANKSPWAGAGVNGRTLSGAGLGLIFSRAGDYALRLDYAWKLSSEEAVAAPDSKERIWIQAVKYF